MIPDADMKNISIHKRDSERSEYAEKFKSLDIIGDPPRMIRLAIGFAWASFFVFLFSFVWIAWTHSATELEVVSGSLAIIFLALIQQIVFKRIINGSNIARFIYLIYVVSDLTSSLYDLYKAPSLYWEILLDTDILRLAILRCLDISFEFCALYLLFISSGKQWFLPIKNSH